jgi:hypothetical protein
MMKRNIVLLLLSVHFYVHGQSFFDTKSDEIYFNRRSNLLEYTTIIEFNNISKDTIFNRAVKWFNKDYQKFNEDKFDTRICFRNHYDTVELKIVGKYDDLYSTKKNQKKKLLMLSCSIELLIQNNKLKVTLKSFILPDFQFVPIEEVVLNDDRSFRRPFRYLNPNINAKAEYLIINLQKWVEDFEIITQDHRIW